MKKLVYLLLLLSAAAAWAAPRDLADKRVPFADPFILLDKGVYYAYGTRSPNGIAVARSRDLKHWQMGCGKSDEQLALHKKDTYGDKMFWAPEVYKVKGKYIMYYSAEEHTCAAVADHPLGPFRQVEQRPLISDMKTIDNSLFFDKDGNPWMVFVKVGNQIWVTEMEKDCLHVKEGGIRKEIIRATEPWEVTKPGAHIAEGPFVVYSKGTYILTYSCNDFRNPDYAVGYATAKSPAGPWTKAAGNPILRRRDGCVGTGHHSLFRDRSGKWRIVYHVHNGTEPGQVQPRRMYIADLTISGPSEAPELKVTGKTIACEVVR